jgi:hypothetical protein
MRHHGVSICTVELKRRDFLALYVSFVINFFGVHQPNCTSSQGIDLLSKAHIAKLNELTELAVSELTSKTVGETAWALLKTPDSCGIRILRLQKKFILDSLVVPILTSLTDTTL